MKLSEAILKGCQTTKPLRGNYIIRLDKDIDVVWACSLGAAAIGAGYNIGKYDINDQTSVSDFIDENIDYEIAYFSCPECILCHVSIFTLVTHLNDIHNWPRETIAEYIAEKGY